MTAPKLVERSPGEIMDRIFHVGDKIIELNCKAAHLRVEYYDKDSIRTQRDISDDIFSNRIKVAELEAEDSDLWNEYYEAIRIKNIIVETPESLDG